MADEPTVDYRTEPSRYRHWKLAFAGPVATLSLDVAEDGGIRDGYKLKLNSYDLGVDIELHDAVQRIRFEHPEVRCVVVTSAKERVFCSGANIFMLGLSSHAWKVNFCKFTNETRNGLEDASRHSGLKFIAAVNGACAGGGYELAIACDEIILVDDRSSSVGAAGGPAARCPARHRRPDPPHRQAPRAPRPRRRLLHAERGRARPEGARLAAGRRHRQAGAIRRCRGSARAGTGAAQRPARGRRRRAAHAARASRRRVGAISIRTSTWPSIALARTATFTVRGPATPQPADPAGIAAAGAQWWPLAMARELDDAILSLRTNEPAIGTWLLKTQGDAAQVLAVDATLVQWRDHWLVRETIGLLAQDLRAAGRHFAHVVRAGRARLVLRGNAVRTGARRRPLLHREPAR